MLGSLFSGITGLNASAKGMEIIGDNIANVNTTAFKSTRASFTDILSDSIDGFSGNELGKGVSLESITTSWDQGSLRSTGKDTDLAVTGKGFFALKDLSSNNAERFTRDGTFRWDSDGYLVNQQGHRVQGYNLITGAAGGATEDIKALMGDGTNDTYTSVSIDANGIVKGISSTGAKQVYQIQLCNFNNIDGLEKLSGNLYAASTASGTASTGGYSGASGYGKVTTNNLEASNVDLATEFVNMITTQKAYQANSKTITTSAEMLDVLVSLVR